MLQEADIEIQNSIEVEIAAEINLPPQPAHHQMIEEHQLVDWVTLDTEIAIVAKVPIKVSVLWQTNRPFSIQAQTIDLQSTSYYYAEILQLTLLTIVVDISYINII